jgi:hypothetical protein
VEPGYQLFYRSTTGNSPINPNKNSRLFAVQSPHLDHSRPFALHRDVFH